MNKIELLSYPSSLEDALQIQEKWRNHFNSEINKTQNISLNDIKIVVGVDISYSVKSPNFGVCCAVIWDFKSKQGIDHINQEGKIDFPYVSGLLAFREGNLIAQTLKSLSKKPDLIMFDGHGYCHPKRFGEAIHIGYALEIPSIGVAKRMLVGEIKDKLENTKKLKDKKVLKLDIIDDKELVGYALYGSNSTKPIYISSGYRTDLETAYQITIQATMNHRLPEPIYLADRISRQKIKDLENKI